MNHEPMLYRNTIFLSRHEPRKRKVKLTAKELMQLIR